VKYTCERCETLQMGKLDPCPDGRPGCLVAHTSKARSYVCEECGHNNWDMITELSKGPHYMTIGMGMANIASIAKLELYAGLREGYPSLSEVFTEENSFRAGPMPPMKATFFDNGDVLYEPILGEE